MPINYSKWDHIELSDDSDIEVHPNVDKRSFIRWKQQDIREKRAQRNQEIKTLLVQLTMYKKLNDRVDYLLETLKPEELLDNKKVLDTLKQKYDPTENFNYERIKKEQGDDLRKGLRDLEFDQAEMENTPPYNEMIEDLLIQIKDEKPDVAADKLGQKLVQELKDHRKKIDDVMLTQTVKLDNVLHEKAQLITPDDYHTGFDRSVLNKGTLLKLAPATSTETQQSIEVINLPSASAAAPKKKYEPKAILDDLILLPETQEFGDIPADKLRQLAEFMISHPEICVEQQKDALIMLAFDVQLEGRTKETRRIVHQSLLIQYVAQLAGNTVKANPDATVRAVKLFFSKLEEPGPARTGFFQDVDNTVKHIETRCKIIEQEQLDKEAGEEEQLIQLKALDEGTELTVNLPEEGTKEYEIFSTKLPQGFQDAIRAQLLDKVNEEFAKLKVEDAEKVLDIFNECGVIGVSGYLENEDEFKALQEQQQQQALEQQQQEAKQQRAAKQEQEFNTQDEVD